jgi:hypothetical protein
MDEQARMKILEMIENGSISAKEGLRLIEALNGEEAPPAISEPAAASPDADPAPFLAEEFVAADQPQSTEYEPSADAAVEDAPKTKTTPLPEDVEKWKRWWMIPLWVGVGILIISAVWMYSAYANSGIGFWFVCSWFPFLFGVGLAALSYGSRRSRWLHLRVDQKPGERPQHIAISMPLPIGLASWFMRTFGHMIPELRDKHVDEMLQAVSDNTNAENPLYIEVDEGENGEKVKVYIG